MNNAESYEKSRRVGERIIPISQVNVTGTGTGSAQTILTTPSNETVEFIGFSVTNKSGSAATFTLHAVPDGDSIGDANKVLDAFNVPANTTLSPLGLLGGAYGPNVAFQIYSGTSAALNVRGAVRASL